MTPSKLVQQRLCNQKLVSSGFQRPVDVVRWLGAVQAQDFNGAKWAVALRMRAATNELIQDAFNSGSILRTHLMRPTWHFVAPEDIRWLLKLTASRINIRCGPNYRKYELDGSTLKRSNKILTKALQGGKHLTRAELKAILNRAGIAADDGVRLAHILLRAELDNIVCSGPLRGKQFTYALLEERVPAAKPLTRDEALAKLARTYFTSHGPATFQDFSWWSGLTAGDARHGITLLGDDLEQVKINDRSYWTAVNLNRCARTSRTNPDFNSQRNAHLLPAYDEYNVAYKDRDAVIGVHVLSPTLVIDGRVIGNWRSTIDKNGVTIDVTAAKLLQKPDKGAVANAANRYAKFLNVPVAHVNL